jgi:predicted Holliday junction resolvase-like endonuclease
MSYGVDDAPKEPLAMTDRRRAEQLIRNLITGGLYAHCPACDQDFRLKDAGLFYLSDFTKEAEATYKERQCQQRERARELREKRQHISKTSQRTSEAVNIGFVLERLAPSMPAFRFETGDCRSLGEPIDYIIFEGLARTGRVKKIIFSDIKTGNARLNPVQRDIRDLIQRKRLFFQTYEQKVADEK